MHTEAEVFQEIFLTECTWNLVKVMSFQGIRASLLSSMILCIVKTVGKTTAFFAYCSTLCYE